MAFHSPQFYLLFLPLFLALFYLSKRYYKERTTAVLIGGSLVFYLLGDLRYLPLLVISISGNWILGKTIHKRTLSNQKSGYLLAAGIVANLVPLILYKYGWIDRSVGGELNFQGTAVSGALPLGISFYTLQQITYLVESQKREIEIVPFRSYFLYVSFFAQLIAGPIVRYSEAFKQFKTVNQAIISPETFAKGVSLLIVGLSKKGFLADSMGRIVDPIFQQAAKGSPLTWNDSWLAGWGYLLQLYFDFSAYSDMAIALGLMVGISLPINFNSPLKAISPTDCINRWHISLTSFIRSFVFSPLFYQFKKIPFFSTSTRTIIAWATATLFAMTAIGVWHGSSATFVISGMLIGVTIVLYQLLAIYSPRKPRSVRAKRFSKLRGRIAVLLTLIVFGVFFRANTLQATGAILTGMLDITQISLPRFLEPYLPENLRSFFEFQGIFPIQVIGAVRILLYLLPATGIALLAPNTNQIFNLEGSTRVESSNLNAEKKRSHPLFSRFQSWSPSPFWAFLCGVFFILVWIDLFSTHFSPNIYGRF